MNAIKVEITPEAIQKHAATDVYDALAQVIFNAIDSEATEVHVDFLYKKQGFEEIDSDEITQITVKDNGTGISPEKVEEYFSLYNKSWKACNKRPDGRDYQGKLGIGRFKYFALGKKITWETISGKHCYKINASYSSPKEFSRTESLETQNNSGTTVIISDISPKVNAFSDKKSFEQSLAELVGLYIKSNPTFKLFVSNKLFTPDNYIDDEDGDVVIFEQEGKKYTIECHFIVWKINFDFKKHKHTYIFNKSYNYKGMTPSGVTAGDSLPYHTVLLVSDFFDDYNDYFTTFTGAINKIKRLYKEKLLYFLYTVKKKRSRELFKIFSEKDFYPFPLAPKNEIEAAERNLFNLCAFSILEHDKKILANKEASLSLLFKLLRKFIEKDSDIASNLSEILSLKPEDAKSLKNICSSSPLPSLIKHYKEIQHRETFLNVLDKIVHEDFYKEHLKERTQLHKILEKETWVFGEKFDFELGTSDQSLTSIIKKNIDIRNMTIDEAMELEKQIKEDSKNKESCLQKIPDLYLWKIIPDSATKTNCNLIIELKAPNVPIGRNLHKQAMDIYNGIAGTDGVDISGKNRWEYWLVSTKITDDMKKLYQGNAEEQRLYEYCNGNYNVYCREWNQIIRDARFKLAEQKKNLEIKISKEQTNNLLEEYLDSVGFPTSTNLLSKPQGDIAEEEN